MEYIRTSVCHTESAYRNRYRRAINLPVTIGDLMATRRTVSYDQCVIRGGAHGG